MLERFKALLHEKKKIEKKPLMHIAITTHGMKSWAEENGKELTEAYKKGFENIKELIKEQVTKNIPIMTIYLIPEFLKEKEHFPIFLDEFIPFLNKIRTGETIINNKIKISAIGKWYDMPGRAVDAIKLALEETKDYDRFFLNFCINYDGQEEIVDACKLIARKIKAEKLDLEAIDKQLIKDNIYSSYFLPPDIIIKNGIMKRTSSLLLWDSVDANLYFTRKYFPDFTITDFEKAIQ